MLRVCGDRTAPAFSHACRCSGGIAADASDVIAPSGMIDGMVGGIRSALDEAGYTHISIMSYAAKYASAFYGPFREAAESTPQFGDRQGYQMDPPNAREALREIATPPRAGGETHLSAGPLCRLQQHDLVTAGRAHPRRLEPAGQCLVDSIGDRVHAVGGTGVVVECSDHRCRHVNADDPTVLSYPFCCQKTIDAAAMVSSVSFTPKAPPIKGLSE